MEKDKIVELIELETKRLDDIKIKRNNIDIKIKQKQAMIERYQSQLEQRKFFDAENVLTAKGLTLDEIMTAIKKGDVLSLQEKIDHPHREEKA